MRQLKSIFIILMMLGLPTIADAEKSTNEPPSRPPITLQKGYGHGIIKYPKAPSRQLITCTYDGMMLELDFTISEGLATLTVTDETPQCKTFTIDTTTLSVSIPIGPLSGSISIGLDTELNNHFTGIID